VTHTIALNAGSPLPDVATEIGVVRETGIVHRLLEVCEMMIRWMDAEFRCKMLWIVCEAPK